MDTKSAARTLDIFETFANLKRPITSAELAKILNAPVSSCFQIVKTLERRGYLYSLAQRQGVYPTGRMMANLKEIATHDPLRMIISSIITRLRDDSNESVLLAQGAGQQALVLDVVESQQAIRYSSETGRFTALHATGVGKAILGRMSPEERKEVYKAAYPGGRAKKQLSPAMIKTVDALEADLAVSRERGWYASRGESFSDLCAYASSFLIGGQIFAIGIAGPFERMTAQEKKHTTLLVEACRTVEERLNGTASK